MSKNAKFVEKYCRNREKWCLICEKWCRNLSKNAKFVEKCEICRKMMSNCRNGEKCCRKILSNYVELCRNRSKLRNLSKNIVEIAKNDVEVYRNGEICRNLSNNVEICRIMSKFFEMAKFVENVFLDFSPYIRKEKPFMWWGPGPWDGCRKRVFGFSHLTWKKRKVIHTAGSLSKKLLEKFQ